MKNKKVLESSQGVNSKVLYSGQQRTKIIIASTTADGSSCYRAPRETFLPFLLAPQGLRSYNGLGLSAGDAIGWHVVISVGMGPVLPHYLLTPVEKSELGTE